MEDSENPDLANLPDALQQAAQNARPVVIMRGGKIVKVYPKLKKGKAA